MASKHYGNSIVIRFDSLYRTQKQLTLYIWGKKPQAGYKYEIRTSNVASARGLGIKSVKGPQQAEMEEIDDKT